VGVALEHAEDVTTVALTGQIEVGATSLAISANRNDSGNWEFSGGLAEGSSIKLRSVINVFLPNALNLPQEVPDMACRNITMTFLPATSQFSFTADSADSWAIPIGSGLSLKDISLRINREKKGTTSQVSGFIGGTLVIGAAYITTAYAFPGDFVLTGEIPSFKLSKLVQDICGVDAALSVTTSVPPGFLDAELTNISFRIAPQQREMSLSGSSKFGQAEIQIKRKADQTWGFAVGLVPPQNWKLSTINDSLAVLDGLQFSNTSLILASSDDSNITLSTVKPPRNDVAIIRGVNLFANLSMTGTGVDSLLGIKTLVVYAAIGSDPQNIKLEAQVDAEYKISDSVYFGNFVFRLQPAPSNFLIALEGNLRVLMSGTDLRFTGGLSVQAKPSFQASMYARMSGTWKDPFGVTGVAISDVGIEFKVPPLTPPSMAFAGALKIGNFTGAMAIKFDPTSPVVAIAFNRLYLSDIFDTFCPPAVKKVIPNGISTTVLNVGFENVKIYIVPKATTIAGVSFAQGTSLEGTMNLWGLRVSASVKIEQSKGVLIKGEVDPVNIGGVFKLTGAGSKPKASLTLDLRAGATPVIDVSGAVELLGYKSETSLQITDKEFNFNTTSKLFNLFQASLQVKGSSMTSSNGIYVKATMQNDLFKYLRDNAAREIEKVANSAKASLDGAISKVNDAKTSVGTLDKQITTAKATVKAERDRDDAKIKTAETDVSKAQTTVNNLQTDIDNAKKRIAQLNQDITNKNNWYNRLAWYDKTWAWTELSAYVAAKGAEITALYTKIAGYEAAKHTAFAVLEAAKVLLGELRKAIKITPIELDYRVASLITLRASAKAALDLAELTLKGLKSSIGAAADVATFITNAGLGGLIDIRKASFEGYLSAMNGGRVSLAVELTFMNSRTVSKYTFTFNFKDPLSSVKDLAKLILPA